MDVKSIMQELLPQYSEGVHGTILVNRTSMLSGFTKYHHSTGNMEQRVERQLREELADFVVAVQTVPLETMCISCCNTRDTSERCVPCEYKVTTMDVQHTSLDVENEDD